MLWRDCHRDEHKYSNVCKNEDNYRHMIRKIKYNSLFKKCKTKGKEINIVLERRKKIKKRSQILLTTVKGY